MQLLHRMLVYKMLHWYNVQLLVLLSHVPLRSLRVREEEGIGATVRMVGIYDVWNGTHWARELRLPPLRLMMN